MGCSCSNLAESKKDAIQEALVDSARFGAFALPFQEEDYTLIYDFQLHESRLLKVVMEPLVSDYTVFINHPLLFVAGGVEKGTNELSSRLWVTSAGEGTVNMAGSKFMSEARRKPFLVSPKEGLIYIIGGFKRTDQEYVSSCEKFKIGDDSIYPLKSMNLGYDHVVAMGRYVYAFGRISNQESFEVFDSGNEESGWSLKAIQGNREQGDISCHERFGILSEDNEGQKLLIFGGLTKEGRHSTEAYRLEGRFGVIRKVTKGLPLAEDFFLPSTAGNDNAYILTRSFKLFVYSKKDLTWSQCATNISAQILQKGLHLKP